MLKALPVARVGALYLLPARGGARLTAPPPFRHATGASQRRRPEEPSDDECCGNGCEVCVWTEYSDRLAAWQAAQEAAPSAAAAVCSFVGVVTEPQAMAEGAARVVAVTTTAGGGAAGGGGSADDAPETST